MDLETALALLQNRFGADHLVVESTGWIRILVASPGSDRLVPVLLTRREAIYLSTTAISDADLLADNLPETWPYPVQLVREPFRAWSCTSGEVYEVHPGERVVRIGRRMETFRFTMPQRPEWGTLEAWELSLARCVMSPRPEN